MDQILATLEIPAIGLTILFVSAVMEYLFPPYPGDTIMVGGFLLAARGDASLPLTFLVALAGSILGAQLAYGIGVRFGDSYFLLRRSSRARERIRRLQEVFGKYGPRLLIFNRFLPGLRGVFLYLSGMNGMKIREVFLYSTLGNVLWIALIAYAGLGIGSNLEGSRNLLREVSVWILGAVALSFLLPWVWRKGKRSV